MSCFKSCLYQGEREYWEDVGNPTETEEGAKKKIHSRRKPKTGGHDMEVPTVSETHKPATTRTHSSARRHRSQSRHERHKCHKHRMRLNENDLINQVSLLRSENYLLNRRLNASMSSIDSGLPNTEGLPPIDIDIKQAYQHLQQENNQLLQDIKTSRIEYEKMKEVVETEMREKLYLKEDISMLKNLIYRLNVELEKFQDIREKVGKSQDGSTNRSYELPKYYNKNFLKPVLPLLKAYTETIQEKNEIIALAEENLEKLRVKFNELLKENDTLHKELEVKLSSGDGSLLNDIKLLRHELQVTKEEKALYRSQSKIEAEKLKEIQAFYQSKVSLLERERDAALENLQQAKAEVYTLRGKHSVVKQELERLRSEEESRVPLVVHSASIGECKRLFQNLKSDHELEKDELLHKLKDFEIKLARKEEEIKKDLEERLALEQGNFDLAFECDALKRRVAELEGKNEPIADDVAQVKRNDLLEKDLQETNKQLRNALKANSDLSGKLQKTKKRLQQSMAFAEDLVQEQESLLAQLHEKQRENSAMVTHFGSLRKKLKNVEKGAQIGLDSVEEKMKSLEVENQALIDEVTLLKSLLKEKERFDAALETEDTTS